MAQLRDVIVAARRSVSSSLRLVPACLVWAGLAAGMAHAQPAAPAPDEAPPADTTLPDFWHQDTLTGDWGGVRTTLAKDGVSVTMTYIGDAQGNVSGGIQRGAVYDGLLQPQVDVDLGKLVGWSGAIAHISMLQITGPSLTTGYTGNLMNVSSINAQPGVRLYNTWLQQNAFDGLLSVRVGYMTADTEFFTSTTASMFVSSTFGWPGILALDLPGGGPAYPLPAPGVRVQLNPVPSLTLLAAVFSGDPSGHAGQTNPVTQQPDGTVISFSGGVFAIAEADYALNQEKDAKGLPATFKLGAWLHSGNQFGDQRFDSNGLSLANPLSNGTPSNHHGDWGLYGIIDMALYQAPGEGGGGLSAFLRVVGAPGNQNLITFYADGGLAYKGLIPSRENDTIGLAVAYARIGDQARALDMDTQQFSNPLNPIRSEEVLMELSYQAQLTPWWVLQPNLQYVANPSGGVDNADGTQRRNAVVVALRTVVTF